MFLLLFLINIKVQKPSRMNEKMQIMPWTTLWQEPLIKSQKKTSTDFTRDITDFHLLAMKFDKLPTHFRMTM